MEISSSALTLPENIISEIDTMIRKNNGMEPKENKRNSGKSLSRRRILTLVGSGLLLPYLGFGRGPVTGHHESRADDDEYDTFLKADGTLVRVKRKSSRKAKLISDKVSNKTLLRWLKK